MKPPKKIFKKERALNKEAKQRLEKYSERFDNDESAIGNPNTWGKRIIEEPKQDEIMERFIANAKQQETLEEAAEIYIKKQNYVSLEQDDKLFDAMLFIAKWQQEQDKQETTADYIDRHIVEAMVEVAKQKMYSEKEVIYLLYSLKNYLGFGEEVEEQKWFEIFKKK